MYKVINNSGKEVILNQEQKNTLDLVNEWIDVSVTDIKGVFLVENELCSWWAMTGKLISYNK